MSQTTAEGSETPDEDGGETDQEILLETHPTLKPTGIWILLTLVAGGGSVGYIFSNPTLLGNRQNTEVVLNIIVILTIIALIRLLIRMYILKQTKYIVTNDSIRREYELLFKKFSRDLPLSMVRSHELRQSRIEAILGVGSVAFLTGTVSQSPAHIEFSAITSPKHVREAVRDQLDV
jgi:hypothetical protein